MANLLCYALQQASTYLCQDEVDQLLSLWMLLLAKDDQLHHELRDVRAHGLHTHRALLPGTTVLVHCPSRRLRRLSWWHWLIVGWQ